MKTKAALLFLSLVFTIAVAQAADFPRKNVNVIVPYGAGGGTDMCIRSMLDSIAPGVTPKGITYVVNNMPGGSGMIGTNKFATSKKDGYTLGVVNCDLLLNITRGVTPLKLNQFVPLSFVQVDPYLVLVAADAPYKTFTELVDYMKAHPGEVKFGDTGPSAVPNFAVLAMQKALGVSVKTMSYDNSLESALAVVRGEVQATVAHSAACIGQLDAKTVIPIAVTSNERMAMFPDVPSIGELYPEEASDMRVICWIASAALSGTDTEVLDYLRTTFSDAVQSDAYKERQKKFRMENVNIKTKADMDAFFAEQEAFYKKYLDK